VHLLRQADRKLGLLREASKCFTDSRRKASCEHSLETMLRQRVFAPAAGEEDLNDHDVLRHDVLMQSAAWQTSALASSPTLCRFENRADREAAVGDPLPVGEASSAGMAGSETASRSCNAFSVFPADSTPETGVRIRDSLRLISSDVWIPRDGSVFSNLSWPAQNPRPPAGHTGGEGLELVVFQLGLGLRHHM